MNQTKQTNISVLFDLAQKNKIDIAILQKALDTILSTDSDQQTVHGFLECFHLPAVNRTIAEYHATDYWCEKISYLVEKYRYHVGHLLKQRASHYDKKPLFLTILGDSVISISYNKVWHDVVQIGRALEMFSNTENAPIIGLLSHNHYNGVILDLACLSFGFRIVPIPINSTSDHLSHILNEAEITHLFIGGGKNALLWNEISKRHDISVIGLNEINTLKVGTSPGDI